MYSTVARRFFHVRFFQIVDFSNETLSPDAFPIVTRKKAIAFIEQNMPNSSVLIEQFKAAINFAEAKRVNGFIQQSIQQYFSQ